MEETLAELSVAPHRSCAVGLWDDGIFQQRADRVAEEVPVALVYNGVSHAVMLATPQDLEDFAVGFSVSEGIVGARSDIFDIDLREHDNGIELDLRVAASCAAALRARRRTLAGRTGCGLCGVESLEQAQCRPRRVTATAAVLTPAALTRAAAALAQRQRLHGLTGAVHAAAWCRWDGEVLCVREDVGRHNALDKLIGALAAARESLAEGFVLMTSRASYEIVCKAAAVGIALVAAISAPTGMAIRVAETAGLTLIGFLREQRFNVYAHPQRLRA
ncbi:MAG: formate dehydrogenase accessory sulfurtransferase FdhD [Rhodocyclaceae bacterium]|nr:formate dehydrogenase accessory sulfurtransferase FdhD [Rhodocyclaceae bacterium]